MQFRAARFFAGDLEGVEVEDTNIVVDDEFLRPDREISPSFGAQIGLDDENATRLQAGQRIRVPEDVGVGRKNDVHIDVFAVDANRLRRGGEIVGRRLTLLFRTVFRIGLDVVAEKFKERHRQILAGSDRAPAAHRMHAHRNGALGQQIGILGTANSHFLDPRIGILQFLLMHFVLGIERVADKIDRQVEKFAMSAIRHHVFNSADQGFRLHVARTQAETAGVEARHVARTEAGVIRIGTIDFRQRAVFQCLAQCRPQFAHQRQILGQRLVSTLKHGNTLLATHDMTQQVARERTIHGDIDHADLDVSGRTQVIGNHLGLHDHRTHADDQVIGIGRLVG